MTDNKLKDNEIIKAFKRITGYQGFTSSASKTLKSTLDLINRLQAQNKDLSEAVHNLILEKDALFDKSEELKSEVERLKEFIVETRRCDKEIKSEVVKEFAERLKNEIISETAYGCDSNQQTGYYDYQIKISDIPEYIDNLVKEMVEI